VSIVINPFNSADEWLSVLGELLPTETLLRWPDTGDPAEVDLLVAWRMPRSEIARFTNLRAILSLGAGVEQWQKPGIPDIPIVRLSDHAMTNEMAAYALHWIIHLQRRFDLAREAQSAHRWEEPNYTKAYNFRIGVLGYGAIGSRIARAFADLGYPVNAWSRSGGDDAGVDHFAGVEQLGDFLGNSDAVINVLPSTPTTTGLLTRERFSQFADGSVFVNIGRGTIIENETDLLDALDFGPIRAAVLDVLDPEPPAADSRLFDHPHVHLTAHVAGSTQVRSAAVLVADNVKRIRSGEQPFPLLDRSRGY